MLDGGKSHFHYGKDEACYYPPTTIDRVLREGDVTAWAKLQSQP